VPLDVGDVIDLVELLLEPVDHVAGVDRSAITATSCGSAHRRPTPGAIADDPPPPPKPFGGGSSFLIADRVYLLREVGV
jgi:hypothetical protein